MNEFYAFWNALQFRDLFEAIVFIFGGSDFLGLMRSMAIIGLLVVVTASILRGRFLDSFTHVFAIALIYGVFILPKMNLIVNDVRTGTTYVVADVPYGVAVPAATFSHIGLFLTDIFETAFIPANDTGKFSRFGMVFPQRLVTAVQNMGAVTVAGREMINAFAKDCVVAEMIETPAKANQIASASDIWTVISTAGWLNPARATVMPNGNVERCDAALLLVETQIDTVEIPEMQKKLGNITLPGYPTPGPAVATALPLAESLMFSVSRSFADSMRQSLLMDATTNGVSLSGASGNSLAMAMNMAVSQANLTSTINYRAMAEIAKDMLPKLRSAIEFLVIAAFPFVFLMVLTAGSKAGPIIKGYLITLAWVQLWPPLYAAVNYLVVMADASPMTQLIVAEGGNSLMSIELIRQFGASSQDVAGMLTMSVPLLAYAIAKSGEVATTAMIGNVMGPPTSTAQQMGGQLAAGNVNGGNLTWGTSATNNVSANGFDRSMRYQSPDTATRSNASGSVSFDPARQTDGGRPVPLIRANQSDLGPVSGQIAQSRDISNASRSSEGTDGFSGSRVSMGERIAGSIDRILSGDVGRQFRNSLGVVTRQGAQASSSTDSGEAVTNLTQRGVTDDNAYVAQQSLAGQAGAGFRGVGGRTAPGVNPQQLSLPGVPAQSSVSAQAGTPLVSLGASADGRAMLQDRNASAVSTNASVRGEAGQRYGAEIAAADHLAATSEDAGTRSAARQVRALYSALASYEQAQEAGYRDTASASSDRADARGVSGRVNTNVAEAAYGALIPSTGSPMAALSAASLGAPAVEDAVRGATTANSALPNAGGTPLELPADRSSARAFGQAAGDPIRSEGAGAANARYQAAQAQVRALVPDVDPSSAPAVGAFQSAARTALQHFQGMAQSGRANENTIAGVTAVAAALDGAQFRGGLGSLRLLGQATGVSQLFGFDFKSGQDFITATNRLLGSRDTEPQAVAALEKFGERVAARNVSEADVRELAQEIAPALQRERARDEPLPPLSAEMPPLR